MLASPDTERARRGDARSDRRDGVEERRTTSPAPGRDRLRARCCSRGGDFYGRPVNLASRITGVARAGQPPRLAEDVREQLEGAYRFSDAGQQAPEGTIRGSVPAYRLPRARDGDEERRRDEEGATATPLIRVARRGLGGGALAGADGAVHEPRPARRGLGPGPVDRAGGRPERRPGPAPGARRRSRSRPAGAPALAAPVLLEVETRARPPASPKIRSKQPSTRARRSASPSSREALGVGAADEPEQDAREPPTAGSCRRSASPARRRSATRR